jgi:putative aminopeptidase FrvX
MLEVRYDFLKRIRENARSLILMVVESAAFIGLATAVITKKVPPEYIIYAQGIATVIKTWYIQRKSTMSSPQLPTLTLSDLKSRSEISIEDRCRSLAEKINISCQKSFGRRYEINALYDMIFEEMTATSEAILARAKAKLDGLNLTSIEKKVLGL